MEYIAPILSTVAWPAVVLIILYSFREALRDLISRVQQVKGSSSGLELVLDRLDKDGQLPFGSRKELAGLTAHDIWALETFADEKRNEPVDKMKPAQRVAVRTLCDAKLLAFTGDGANRKVIATALGKQILTAANELL